MKIFKGFVLCILASCIAPVEPHAYRQVSCIVHIHSTFSSSGRHSLEELVLLARKEKIDVIVITDHDIVMAEYGVRPLSNILKRSHAKNSIFQIGYEKYLNEIKRLQEKYPDMIIMPGFESTPHYYWSGSPFTKGFTLNNAHKHLVVTGLDDPEQFKNLPVLGNRGAEKFRIILLWPVATLLLGMLLIKKHFGPAVFVLLISAVFIVNNFPFKSPDFSQYKDGGEGPYQSLIDYVVSQEGVVFWAHPEARNYENATELNGVKVRTKPYPDSLVKTRNYTGFAYFWEGDDIVGVPGGLWDRVLNEYQENKRKKPVWAFGELDYISDGYNGTYMNMARNILFVNSLNREEVLDAIRTGRFYVAGKWRPDDWQVFLREIEIGTKGVSATMGEELQTATYPSLRFVVDADAPGKHNAEIKIVLNGIVVETLKKRLPAAIEVDMQKHSGILRDKNYCRVEVKAENNSRVVTNPLFFGIIE